MPLLSTSYLHLDAKSSIDDWNHPKLDECLRHPFLNDWNHPKLDNRLQHPKIIQNWMIIVCSCSI